MATTLRNMMASTNLERRSAVTYCFDEHSCQGRTKKSSNALEEQTCLHFLTWWWKGTSRDAIFAFRINYHFLLAMCPMSMVFDHLSRSHDAKGRWEEVEAENRDKQWGGGCYPCLGVLIMVRMDWNWFRWIESDSDGLKQIQIDWNGFRWIETDSDGLKWAHMNWNTITWIEGESDWLKRIKMDWNEFRWNPMLSL